MRIYSLFRPARLKTGLALFFAATISVQAELKLDPLLLKERGHYIEVTESNFRRISTISHVRASISGTIHQPDGRVVRVENFYFPLNDKGIGEFQKLVGSQPKTAKCFPTVRIRIDDATYNLIQTDKKNPMEDLEKFSVEVRKAAKQLDTLLQLASEG